ncbi:hypothetical protein MTO96_044427 [Rhipicephalus appendiculatus]
MYSAIPPPPFLQCPGVPPIPWKKWRRVLQVYIDAAAPDATPERKKVLLLNALGVEGLHTYYKAADEQTQLDGDQATGDGAARDAYQQALAVLDAYFAPPEEAVCVRARFRRRVQQPDETAVQFMQALRRSADNCSFGTAAATMLRDQILQGLRDPNLRRTFIQMGDAFTIQSALEHAREEERVDRALQQLTSLQVDSATRREPGRRGGRPPRPTLQQRASIHTAPSAPPSVCYRCGSPHHWANFPSCPARWRTCNSCGKQGHFSEMCRSAGTSVAVPDGDAGQECAAVHTDCRAGVRKSPDRVELGAELVEAAARNSCVVAWKVLWALREQCSR